MTRNLLALSIIIILLNVPASAEWVTVESGQIPPNALVAGQSSDNQPAYVCRAQHEGGIHPGMINPSGACDIAYQGGLFSNSNYEVLVGNGYSWVANYNGEIPFDAFPAGTESQGEILYICRGDVDSRWHSGKISQSNSGCSVPYAGKELNAPWYEVLVGN